MDVGCSAVLRVFGLLAIEKINQFVVKMAQNGSLCRLRKKFNLIFNFIYIFIPLYFVYYDILFILYHASCCVQNCFRANETIESPVFCTFRFRKSGTHYHLRVGQQFGTHYRL